MSGRPNFVDLAKVALWPNKEASGNDPVVTGKLEVGEVKFRMAYWKTKSDHPSAPTYDGKLQGVIGDQAQIQALEDLLAILKGGNASSSNANAMRSHKQPPQEDFDDDIPF